MKQKKKLKSFCSYKQKCTMTEKHSFYMLSFNAHLADNKNIYYIFGITYTNFSIVLCRKKFVLCQIAHTENNIRTKMLLHCSQILNMSNIALIVLFYGSMISISDKILFFVLLFVYEISCQC